MAVRRFIQCDVFTATPTKGNGLAVVVDAAGLDDTQMQSFAAWTNLAETTFLLPPSTPEADYKVRIFTPAREMPFAGHPTLGSCAAWLRGGGVPRIPQIVRQECGVGIVDIDLSGTTPAFVAPPTSVNALPDTERDAIVRALDIDPSSVIRTALLANGPTWRVLQLRSATNVLAVDSSRVRWPEFKPIGLIGAHPVGAPCHYEARMLAPSSGMSEDPITGSLNAAIAQMMFGAGIWTTPIVVAQGTRIGREGRISISRDAGGRVLIGGNTCILVEGTVSL